MAAVRTRLRGWLRSRRRPARSARGQTVDVDGLICTFSSIDILGPLPAGVDPGTLVASLRPSKGRLLNGIHVDTTAGSYRVQLPVARLARLVGESKLIPTLESGSDSWPLTRLASPTRRPVTLPTTVVRHGEDSIRIRIVTEADGSLVVHSSALSAAR